jgi:hypothetical protein
VHSRKPGSRDLPVQLTGLPVSEEGFRDDSTAALSAENERLLDSPDRVSAQVFHGCDSVYDPAPQARGLLYCVNRQIGKPRKGSRLVRSACMESIHVGEGPPSLIERKHMLQELRPQ